MSEYIAKHSAAKLLEKLSNKGFVINKEVPEFIMNRQQRQEFSLYLKLLSSIGAFIASLCFIAFLQVADIINLYHAEEVVTWGLAFIIGAIILKKIASYDSGVIKYSFFMQSSLIFMVVGKMLFVFGMERILNSKWAITQGLLIITIATYYIYNVSIDRFLSSFAVLCSIFMNILWKSDIIFGSRELMMNMFFLLQLISVAVLLMYGRNRQNYIPLFYAFVFSLYVNMIFLSLGIEFGNHLVREVVSPEFINVVLAGGLIFLFILIADDMRQEPLLLASLGALFLGLISAPGVLLTIGLLVLGYARHEKPLTISGIILLPIFILLYYNNLDISLLQKSGVLIGSGTVLLIARCYLKYRGWDKGGVSCVQK